MVIFTTKVLSSVPRQPFCSVCVKHLSAHANLKRQTWHFQKAAHHFSSGAVTTLHWRETKLHMSEHLVMLFCCNCHLEAHACLDIVLNFLFIVL